MNTKTLITRKFQHADMAQATLKVLISEHTATVVRTLPAGMDIAPTYWRDLSLDDARAVFTREQNNLANWTIVSTTEKVGNFSIPR